jgi:hypothetical protein
MNLFFEYCLDESYSSKVHWTFEDLPINNERHFSLIIFPFYLQTSGFFTDPKVSQYIRIVHHKPLSPGGCSRAKQGNSISERRGLNAPGSLCKSLCCMGGDSWAICLSSYGMRNIWTHKPRDECLRLFSTPCPKTSDFTVSQRLHYISL